MLRRLLHTLRSRFSSVAPHPLDAPGRTFATVGAAAMLSVASVFCGGFSAAAAPYGIDKIHAYIGFSISHLGFSETQGHFDDYDAQINFDPDRPQDTQVSFTIYTRSIDTNSTERDQQLRSPSFFNVARFPTMTFVSRRVRVLPGNRALITGELTMLGRTHTENFTATLKRVGVSALTNRMTAGFEVTGVVDRTKYGMTTFAPAVGSAVNVVLNFEMVAL